jgi:membrane protease YdiL (CAAX protease family)
VTDALPPSLSASLTTRKPPANFWSNVLVPLGCVPLALVAVGILFELLSGVGVNKDAAETVAQFSGSLLILGLAVLLRQRCTSHRRRLTTATRPPTLRRVLLAVPIGIAMTMMAVTVIWAGTAIDSGAEKQLKELSELYVPASPIWQKVLLGVALVVLAPLGEELLFRGLVLRALVTRVRFAVAAPISGVLFAASHPDAWLLWPRAVALAILGTVLAWTYRRHGYRGSVTAHATVNTIAFASLLASS